MTSSRKGLVLIGVLLVSLSGCSSLGGRVATVSVASVSSAPAASPEQAQMLAKAVEYLQLGNEPASRDLLEMLVEDSARIGVTDEALFRLSLLYLRDEGTKGTPRIQQLLTRLIREFPQSVWSHQAAPLAAYLAEVKNLRDRQRELKSLRETNLSLSRDNKELRQSIERIKNLDLELEQKIKR